MAFLRWQIFTIYGVVLLSIWLAALQATVTTTTTTTTTEEETTSGFAAVVVKLSIQWAPLWGILMLGFYSVSWIAYGVVTLRDNPDSAKELEQQVKEARAEMKRRGIILT
eukprot:CAMPEP_0198146254 /NCGR_PEP_ID=MMETSP1443-20131203/28437_1 /TAXON_ID=186043 /ORGANISM="Entomoneis sp., Strain CCMP2396" /LENGTH=109 /DNA_ID=CAMNT_0043810151 /DNA_START=59 /DNA_END=388 /DNA_ORIENTATION=+